MKRPLCLLAILLSAAVYIYLELFLSDITGKVLDETDGASVSTMGIVCQKEVRRDFQGQYLPVIYILPKDQTLKKYSLIQCYLESWENLPKIGEYAEVKGRMKVFSPPTNPGEFDSRLYYSTLKISYRIKGASVVRTGGKPDPVRESLYNLKVFLEKSLDRVLTQEDSGIMKAMLLGDKAFMDEEIKELYKSSGIMHILAVSGLHISIIGMGVYKGLRKLLEMISEALSRIGGEKRRVKGKGRSFEGESGDAKKVSRGSWLGLRFRNVLKRVGGNGRLCDVLLEPWFGNALAAVAAIMFMYAYGVMCGMGTSSFRAICMFALRLLAPLMGRTYDVLSGLSLSAILLLLDQPLFLYNSGFLFSFGAVLGISVVKPVLLPAGDLMGEGDGKMRFAEDKKKGAFAWILGFANDRRKALLNGALVSISVMLVTLPVYAVFYYTFPLQSLILNLLVIPIMGVLMMLGIVCMLIGTVWSFMTGSGDVMGNVMTTETALTNANVLSAGSSSNLTDNIIAVISALPGGAVRLILSFYRWLCSGSRIRSGFTWYMGHSDKWQVFAYILLMTIFVLMSVVIRDAQPVYGKVRPSNSESDQGYEQRNDVLGKINAGIGLAFGNKKTFLMIVDLARGMLIISAIILLTIRIRPDLSIQMIDVGQGDGILISTAGRNMLIDGGSTSNSNVGKYQIIPFLKYKGIGSLDTVVLTHEDKDHMSGILEIMDDMEKGGIRIKQLILPEVSEVSRGDNYHELEDRARKLGIPISYINTGESFSLGKAYFTCLNPSLNMVTDGANAYSTVLFMEYKGTENNGSNGGERFTALFTGDMEEEGLEHVKSVLKSMQPSEGVEGFTLLKVAHHGSRYTTDEEFLSLTAPKLSFISCGRDNSYGHPHKELLDRLNAHGSRIFRTDQSGALELIIYNGKLQIKEYINY